MQDTPAVKYTYHAEVAVKDVGYTVRMSAKSTGNYTKAGGWKVFTF